MKLDAYLVEDHVGRMVETKETHDKGKTYEVESWKEAMTIYGKRTTPIRED